MQAPPHKPEDSSRVGQAKVACAKQHSTTLSLSSVFHPPSSSTQDIANPVWPRLYLAFRRADSTAPLQKSVMTRLVHGLWGVDCHLRLGHANTILHVVMPTWSPHGYGLSIEHLYMSTARLQRHIIPRLSSFSSHRFSGTALVPLDAWP
jgi:hypothetical protein